MICWLGLLLPLFIFLLQPRGHLPKILLSATCQGAPRVKVYAFLAVGSHVLSHITRLDEGLLTNRANVVSLSCVRGGVSLKVRFLHECLSTVGADKLFFAFVVPQMVLVD